MALALALGQVQYVPRQSSSTLKRIVEDHLDELQCVYDDRFRSNYGPLHPRVIDLFERFVRCGDPHFGFLRFVCSGCDAERLLPFSCKARGLCPSCGKKRALVWAEHMVETVLPEVPYAPLTFTIPKILRPMFKFDHTLYGDLCRATYAAIRKLCAERFPDLNKPVPAFVASPQSFGSLLNLHPHVHGLCSLGVFDHEGTLYPDPDIDFSQAELPFREELFRLLRKKDRIDDERIEMMRSWPHSGFRVHAENPIDPNNKKALESILEYMERPPVSLKRLSLLDTGMVTYEGKFHPSLNRDHQVVTGLEFLAMLVPHIALRYESKARCYGAISTTLRRKFGWTPDEAASPDLQTEVEGGSNAASCRACQDDKDSAYTIARRRSWARLIRKVWLDDPEECLRCGERMKLVAVVSSPLQDELIKETLTARGEWHPPWSGRDPPTQGHSTTEQLPERTVEIETDPEEFWDD